MPLLFMVSIAHAADTTAQSATGIPIDYLFGSIAALLSIIYLDMKRDIRNLQKEGKIRTRHLSHVENVVRKICAYMKLEYRDREDLDL